MFTYGYIREAAMAHLDIDEEEAQAMNLLDRFHIFANEAMQAICSSKPMYQYIDVTVVDKFAVLAVENGVFREATEAEIEGTLTPGVRLATDGETEDYYHKKGIYAVGETMTMTETFIAFADKQAYKIVEYWPSVSEVLEAEAFGTKIKKGVKKENATSRDFSYIGQNKILFHKSARFLIPAKYLWFKFRSDLSDKDEIDMPSDILLTIPIYIASICFQVDSVQRANIKRNEFELALSRCTSTDFMPVNEIVSTW